MQKEQLLYTGKAKSVYSTTDPRYVIVEFRNDISAFNALKLAKLPRKGMVNNYINAFIMEHLKAAGLAVDFERILDDTHCLVKRLQMLPLEAIVRNIATGSLTKRLGIESGRTLSPPLFEFFLKNDALGDPLITEDHIATFNWATPDQVREIRQKTLQINSILQPLFDKADIKLVDFKVEFGLFDGQLTLGDEISPDGCRLWDKTTNEMLDKERFRQDLGEVVEHYEEVARRLGVKLPH
jgi:phosphoribosylaminoimidazole-succinocarboxamide synthase